MGLRVTVLLGETKVDHIDLVAAFADTHKEIIGLDVSMDKIAGVDVLDTGDQLVGEEKNGLEAELPVAEVEEVLKRRAAGPLLAESSGKRAIHSQQIHHHGIVVALCPIPPHERHSDPSRQ